MSAPRYIISLKVGDMTISRKLKTVLGDTQSLQQELALILQEDGFKSLAEGLAGLPAPKTVVTVTPVQARIIPLHKVDHMVPNLPHAIRQTIRTTVKRTLALNEMPKGVL